MEDQNFDDMTEDELAQYINDNQENDSDYTESINDDEPAKETEATEDPSEDEDPGTPDDELEPDEIEDTEDEFTKGKTRAELLQMIKNGTQKISQQGNEVHTFKTELEQMKEQLNALKKPVHNDEDQEVLNKYDEEDIKAIERIVKRSLRAERDNQEQQTKAQIERANQDNESAWEIIRRTDPEFSEQKKEVILSEIRANRKATFDKPGWIIERVMQLKSSNAVKPVSKSVVKRPISKTVSAGNASKSPNRAQSKSIDQMDHEEYAEHLKSQGMDLFSGRRIA